MQRKQQPAAYPVAIPRYTGAEYMPTYFLSNPSSPLLVTNFSVSLASSKGSKGLKSGVRKR
jgi:hypothetical protein